MVQTTSSTYNFLEDGGEMGALTRAFDWSTTEVGPVEQWPQSLRTIVGVILHSEVPMFLWWGDEMIQFYNDAYRPSLGNDGKHPTALGQRGEACWPEIWPIIKPLIDKVKAGGATWSEDQLIPIYRNGKVEDVYWTFGYSPVFNDTGHVVGVLVVCNETTQQVNALKKLESNEKTLRSIVFHAPVGICIVDGARLTVEVVNDLYLNLVGTKREEMEGRPLWDVLPEAREQYGDIMNEVVRTGIAFKGTEERVLFRRHGIEETRYLDLVCEPMKTEGGMASSKVMLLAIDVTDRVVARKKIEESEQRYRTLITESTVAIALYTGSEFRIQYVNQIMTRYWGRDANLVGKTLRETLPELEGQSFLEKIDRVFRTGETYVGTAEKARLLVDGKLQPFYFNYIFKALRNAEGVIYGIHHMAMDVTEQVLTRKKLEQSEANLRNVILKAPVAMCILKGPEFVVEIANERMFALWGIKRDDALGRPIFEGLPEARDQGFEEILQGVYETEQTFSAFAVPTTLPREGGVDTVYINFVYEPYRDTDGKVSGIMVVATDVTEQAKARLKVEEVVEARTRELKDSNMNLQRSNEELAQFAYIASHDLQEPARKIRTFSEMLSKNMAHSDAASRALLEKIERASARMLSLIRDVLTYSQLAKSPHDIKAVDLNEILTVVLNDFELLIEEKGAIISADTLPVLKGIPVQINQLFGNLISNALKFTDERRSPVIAISSCTIAGKDIHYMKNLKRESSYYRITFRDNGIGFSQNHSGQIFDIFQRLHPKAHFEGTGIGLAMCRKIAQNHNGDIYAESVEGEGSAFHVLLPVPSP